MKYRKLLIALISLPMALPGRAAVTIEECVAKAESNYPLIQKYDLLRSSTEIELSDINKGWLPRIAVSAQVTGQNVVPSFPNTLSEVLERMGQQMKGLGKIQYRAGIDINQTLWDGGASRQRREITRSRENVEQSALQTELYGVRQRVENLYFAILLIEQQIAQSEATHELLLNNRDKLQSMLANGVATQSDVDMIEAQALTLEQTIAQARIAADGYRRQLSLFIGEEITEGELVMPVAALPAENTSNRPELKLLDDKVSLLRASEKMSDTALYPKIGFFAQTYYGYPGIDYFKSMMSRDMTFNVIAGVKLTWNIDSFYTKKSNNSSTKIQIAEIEADRETFDFNTRLMATSQNSAIQGLKAVIKDDSKIVDLRSSVRRAAESQLSNGIIDATALLVKITDENAARITMKYHEIQLLNEIYKLKYTLNR